jgi:hypothetical protein
MPASKNRHILSFAIARRLENPALTRQDVGMWLPEAEQMKERRGAAGSVKSG